MNSILIYTEQTSNRLRYIFDLLVGDLLGLQYELTHDKTFFANHNGAKFSYASTPVDDELFFECCPLLYEAGVFPPQINFCEDGKLRGFHPVSEKSTFNFDIFASAFFQVTRYMEYLPHKPDKYGRFRASQSFNSKGGFLEKPMVNYYAVELKKTLAAKYPELVFKKHKFQYIATFDIDFAYAYRGKGLYRNTGGFLRSFMLSDFNDIKNRIRVLFNKNKDPYDNYDFIFRTLDEFSIPSKFFFLMRDDSRFDKNIPYTEPIYRNLIKKIAAKTEIGIHLSFKSHVRSHYMREEINRLEEIAETKVAANRFHYLRFQLPDSYQRLIKLGITEEHSMGYAPHPGFRSGICTPYYFFNLKTNEVTPLKIVPFAFMDTTFTEYRRCDNNETLETIRNILYAVKECEGTCVALWHNSSFSEQGVWKGWRNIFETVSAEASELMRQDASSE